jgi:hypothetical protein
MGGNFGQSVNGRQRANTSRSRPATAMGNRGPDSDAGTGSQCTNSQVNFFLSSRASSSSHATNGAVFNHKFRGTASMSSFPCYSPSEAANSRKSSISSLVSKMGHMTISEEREAPNSGHHQNGGQVNSTCNGQAAARPSHQPRPRLSSNTARPGRRENVAGQ